MEDLTHIQEEYEVTRVNCGKCSGDSEEGAMLCNQRRSEQSPG